MKIKVVVLLTTFLLLLTACGQGKIESVTLVDQHENEVTFPLEKPTLFFFITSYN